ncbi:MAG: NAD(P)-dependent oxidoreductase [Patescibacteria group bacterium]
MKIGFFEAEGWEEKTARESLPGHELYFSNKAITEEELPERNDFEILSVFVNSHITAKVLEHFPNLKMLTTNSTGFDHIDLEACKAKGIKVGYVPGYGNNTVAELAFGLLLNLTRKIYLAVDRIKESGSFSLEGLRGIDLKGRTIGIIGTGRIGLESARIANGFGMKIIAYDVIENAAAAKELGFIYLPLEELLKQSDVLTIHCPLTPETHHLINTKNVGLIKKGAYLVNTARGPIVETDALVKALQDGTLAGAGLDVLEEESGTKYEKGPEPSGEAMKIILENHALIKMPNVLITPHNAFNTVEALMRILTVTLQNISGFINNSADPKNFIA